MNSQLQAIIAGVLGVAPEMITPESKAEDFENWDSLAQVMMISAIQDQLGIEIPFEKMQSIASVQDFIDCLE
jgi:acyl carrier protein